MNILFIIILILLLIGIILFNNYSPFGSNTTSINICLITYKPNDKLLEFLDTFKNHDVYIIIDDNTIDYTTKYINDKYKNLTFIQIDPKECQDSGFINSSISAMGPSKQIIAWDKALYYISTINTNYSHTWFIEDDVFLYNEEILNTIDSSYPTSDILTQKYIEANNNWYHFKNLNYSNDYSPPYYHTLICICRMSKKMMKLLKQFANKNKSLQYIESLYSTVAIKNKLKYDTPSEFDKIHWNHIEVGIDKNFIYHPVKDQEYQKQLRI
jgi:hypothetical protein